MQRPPSWLTAFLDGARHAHPLDFDRAWVFLATLGVTRQSAIHASGDSADSVHATPWEKGARTVLMPGSRLSAFERVRGLLAALDDWQYDEAFRVLRDHFMPTASPPEEASTAEPSAGPQRP